MTLTEIYNAAGLTAEEQEEMANYFDALAEFYGTPAFNKLFEYFAFETAEMPYEVAKARTDTPDNWILDRLEN